MKTITLCITLLLGSWSISMAQSGIPWKNTGTKTRPTTTQPAAAPQPMQVTPRVGTGSVETKALPKTESNVVTMSDGTRLTITLLPGQTNLPSNLGGSVTEREITRTTMNSNDPSWNCQSVTKSFSATSNNFLNNDYSGISATIFPGAIYNAKDFLTGNRKSFEYSRNPVEIGVDNVLNTVGPTYRTLNQPTQNEINTAIASIAQTMNGSGEDIKYRVYISESDAEMALNAAAGGSFAGFSLAAAYKNNSKERVYILTIDATKTYFTTTVNMPANGYFSDPSIAQNNGNMVVIKNVVFGCRVLANVVIKNSNRQDEINFNASYKGVSVNADLAFNYFKSHQNFESTVNGIVIGGPSGTSIFNAATLREEIQALMARADYRSARPISYTLTDLNGNVLGIQSATDQITVPVCTPKSSVYTLKNARIEVSTGSNDPKNDGSKAYFRLYNSQGITTASSTGDNNIEFPVNSMKPLHLTTGARDDRFVKVPVIDLSKALMLESFTTGYLDISFSPVQIFAGWDEWQIRGVDVYLQFVDQSGMPFPGNNYNNEIKLTYSSLNVFLKKDRSTLRLPFTVNGAIVNAGGPFQL